MATNRRFTFSLLTIFLLTVIVALFISQVLMMRELHEARQELLEVRKEFGYIKPPTADRIQIARIEGGEQKGVTRYRMRIPPGHQFMLHISEMKGLTVAGYPENLEATKTMSMNSWREGADCILQWSSGRDPDGTKCLDVATDSEELFHYRLEDWKPPRGYPNSSWELPTDERQSFSPDETIRFMTFENDRLARGVVLWMEPAEQWLKRRGE